MSIRVRSTLPALLLALVSAPAFAQEPAPKPTPPGEKPTPPSDGKPVPPAVGGAGANAGGAAPVLVGSDGQPLAPGRIPTDTAADARAAWDSLLAATLGTGSARKPVTAFSLQIDVEYKQGARTNNTTALYEYVAPGNVRARFERSNRETLRGPDGDWLIDPTTRESKRIERDRDSEQDARQLDDLVSVARNFIALTDPKSLRIARLAKLAAPPTGIGKDYAARAMELTWLDVESPDFRLVQAPKANEAAALYRVQLGLDPKTALPALALVHEAGGKARIGPSTLFLELAEWYDADGARVPKVIRTFEVDEASIPSAAGDASKLRFRLDPTSDVFLKQARINPPLTADSFRPPKKT